MKAYFHLFWSNIKRFWPLFLVALLPTLLTRYVYRFTQSLSLGFMLTSIEIILLFCALYGFVTALFLWGDLLSTKRNGMFYSMPVTRTGLFLTQYMTGILFSLSLVPMLGFLLGWVVHNPLLGVFLSAYFLFYGLGTLSVMLSGNLVGAIISGLSVFFLPFALRWFFETMFMPYLPSVGIDNSIFIKDNILLENIFNYASSYSSYLWIFGGVFSVLAFVLLLLRKAERTGQFTVFALLHYVFCCVASLIAAVLAFRLLKQDPETDYWFFFLYIPIFYFAFAMVAEKRFLVFQKGHLLTLGILAAVLFNSFWMVRLDAFGILTYVPDPKNIKYAELYRDDYSVNVKYDPNGFNRTQITVRGTENLTLLTEVHESLLDNMAFSTKESDMVYITYTMKSGIKIRRYYPTYDDRSIYKKLQAAVSNNKSIFGTQDWESFRDRVFYIEVKRDTNLGRSYYFTDDEELEVPGGDVKILGSRLRNHMLKMLMRDADHGDLLQLDYSQYHVTVKYYDDRGKQQTKKLIIPNTITGSASFLAVCWDSVRGSSDRTITDETPLFRSDPTLSANGSGESFQIPYHISD